MTLVNKDEDRYLILEKFTGLFLQNMYQVVVVDCLFVVGCKVMICGSKFENEKREMSFDRENENNSNFNDYHHDLEVLNHMRRLFYGDNYLP